MDEKMELNLEELDQVSGGKTLRDRQGEFLFEMYKKYGKVDRAELLALMNEEELRTARELGLI